MRLFSGCYTALITPMKPNHEIDFNGMQKLVEFQTKGGVQGILAVGTTGESPTLNWAEHILVIEKIREQANERCLTIAGTGSNSTKEAIRATRSTLNLGLKTFLLIDPYYNGPSSIEIRKEYVEPLAKRFPEAQFIPYVIPSRTGTQLLPQDLAILHSQFANVRTVKEATGSLENMRSTRKLCGEDFDILSGDDDKTFEMMTSSDIRASGVISVASNVVPEAVQNMIQYALEGRREEASKLYETLKPLFSLVTVKTEEQTSFGPITCKARNPLPYKVLMNILGMPSGPCRRPLGKMTRNGIEIILAKARQVYDKNPEILRPVEAFFDVNLNERLYEERFWRELVYD